MEVESIAALVFDILRCTNVTKISMLECLHLVSDLVRVAPSHVSRNAICWAVVTGNEHGRISEGEHSLLEQIDPLK